MYKNVVPMRFYKIIIVFSVVLISLNSFAQTSPVKVLEAGRRVSFRGLSVVNDRVFWASGSNGTVVRSLDGGNTLEPITVLGYEKRDFRDIEAIDAQTAVIMAIAEPAVILKTKDGGKSWAKVFEDTTKGMFLDAMDLYIDSAQIKKNQGTSKAPTHTMIVVGDPIHGKLFVAMSFDAGDNWQVMPALESKDDVRLVPDTEAMFASSGTNVKLTAMGNYSPALVATGGTKARLKDLSLHNINDSLPIMQGGTSTGANSIDVYNKNRSAVIVGGDFAKDSIGSNNCVLVSFETGKPVYSLPETMPHGFRSCVIYLDANNLVACGTSGIDISKDAGKNWQLISKESFHVVQKARNGKAIYMAGGGGRIAQLILP
ncbi:MAG TPA: oxidoreductase [Chitinophagaceae bacterium]|nr:oxidoreductase [Chitinophagaceae bacterium]